MNQILNASTVYQNLGVVVPRHSLSAKEVDAYIIALANRYELEYCIMKYPFQLNGIEYENLIRVQEVIIKKFKETGF